MPSKQVEQCLAENREYLVVKSLVDALSAICTANSDEVIDLLTGYLWDEEEAGHIKTANRPQPALEKNSGDPRQSRSK